MAAGHDAAAAGDDGAAAAAATAGDAAAAVTTFSPSLSPSTRWLPCPRQAL